MGFGTLGSHWSSRFVILSIVRHVFEYFEQFNNNDPLEAGPRDVARRGVNSFIKLLCLCADVHCLCCCLCEFFISNPKFMCCKLILLL
jgi:hypothetical protein